MNQENPFWNNNGQIIAVAHRGGDAAGVEKENSLVAFTAAAKLGYTYFETDVVSTSDEVLLATHGRGFQLKPNEDLPSRTTIQGMTYLEAQEKLIVGGEPPATLEELLLSFPECNWFIDPKVNGAVNPLIKVLSNPKIQLDRISVGCFNPGGNNKASAVANALEQIRGQRICTSLNPFSRFGFAILAASDVELNSLEPRDRIAVKLLKRFSLLPDISKHIKDSPWTSLHVPYRWVSHSTNLLDIAHSLNLKIATWTPNKPDDIQASINKGVDAVMSDSITTLKDALLKISSNNPSITGT